jgi:ATP-dependent exoDNAse (exonuclease V) beta subunit
MLPKKPLTIHSTLTMSTEIQLVHGIPNADYHHDYPDFISSTSLKEYGESQMKFLAKSQEERVHKYHFDFGSLWHDMIAARHPQGENWEPYYHVFQPAINEKTGQPYGSDTKAQQEARALALSENPNKVMISQTDKDACDAMVDRLFNKETKGLFKSFDFFHKMFERGTPEASYFAPKFYKGINVRVRPDLDGNCSMSGKSFILDYKSIDFPLSEFKNRIEKLHYDISAAMYVEVKKQYMRENGFVPKGGEAMVDFYWLVQEKSYPYDWMVVSAEHYLPTATEKFYQCLMLHQDALETGKHKGISDFSSDPNGIFRPQPAAWSKSLNKML